MGNKGLRYKGSKQYRDPQPKHRSNCGNNKRGPMSNGELRAMTGSQDRAANDSGPHSTRHPVGTPSSSSAKKVVVNMKPVSPRSRNKNYYDVLYVEDDNIVCAQPVEDVLLPIVDHVVNRIRKPKRITKEYKERCSQQKSVQERK